MDVEQPTVHQEQTSWKHPITYPAFSFSGSTPIKVTLLKLPTCSMYYRKHVNFLLQSVVIEELTAQDILLSMAPMVSLTYV